MPKAASITDPDTDLIPRLQAGDEAALAELMERRMKTIHALAARLLGDAVMAEDVAQTVFLKTWTHIKTWKSGSAKLQTWMCRVATNQCLDILKRKGPIYTENLPDIADSRTSAMDKLRSEDDAARVRMAMNALTPSQRAAITLCYFEELSQKEASQVLDINEKAYESLLSRGRKALRQILNDTETNSVREVI